MDANFSDAVIEISEVMIFETWLRFYFIEEKGNDLYLNVPDKTREKIAAEHEDLVPLMDSLIGVKLDYTVSVSMVSKHVMERLDGQRYRAGLVGNVLDSREFQTEMQIFHTWMQMHEDQLEADFFEYGKWLEMVREWKNSDDIKDYFEQIRASSSPAADGGETMQ